MRRAFLVVLVFLIFMAGVFLWILAEPRALAGIAGWSLERSVPGLHISEFRIHKQRFPNFDTASFYDVLCTGQWAAQSFNVSARTVDILGLGTALFSDRQLLIKAAGIDAGFLSGHVRGGAGEFGISFSSLRDIAVDGPVAVGGISWEKMRIGPATFRIWAGRQIISIGDIRAEAYGGRISGSAKIFLHPVRYDADVKLEGLQASGLSDVNAQIPAQMAGMISGTVRVAGDAFRMDMLDAELGMPAGGKINAALLSTLVQYLPKSEERERLDLLIRSGGKLAVEVFSFTIKNNAPDHLSGMVRVASRDANLQLNLAHDIRVDGSWDGLARSWQEIFK